MRSLTFFLIYTTSLVVSSPIILFPDEIAKLLEKEASLSRSGDSSNPEYQYWLDNCTKEDEMPYFNGGFQLLDLIITELKSHMTC